MSRLVTQLVSDEPAVVLLGENSLLRERIVSALHSKSVETVLMSPKNIFQNENEAVLDSAYKVVWIADPSQHSNEYVPFLQNLAQRKAQVIVVLPVFSGISFCQSDLLRGWLQETQQQLQFIVDCNYYLSSASFIFGQNIIGNSADKSIFNYILSSSKEGLLVDVGSELDFLSMDDFVSEFTELLFIPKKQISYLVKGKKVNSTGFVALIKKLYDAYHNTNLEVIQDSVSFSKTIPFSVTEKTLGTDERAIATYLVKAMDAPKKAQLTELQEKISTIPQPTVVTEQVVKHPNSFVQTPAASVQNATVSAKSFTLQVNQIDKSPETYQSKPVKQEISYTQNLASKINAKTTDLIQNLSETKDLISNAGTRVTEQVFLQTADQAIQHVQELKLEDQPNFQPEPKSEPKSEDIDLNQEIQKIFKETRTDKKVERVEKIVKSTKTITKKSKRKTKLFYGGLLSVGMAIGMIILATTYFISGSSLQKQVVNFLSTTSETKDLTNKPGLALLKTTSFVKSQTNLYGQIIELNSIAKNSVLVSLVEQFEFIPEILAEADKASKNLVLNILSGNIGNTADLTENLTQKVSEAYEKLSLIQASLEQVDLGGYSEKQQAVIDQIGEKIQEFRSGLEIHQQLQQVLPDIFGSSKKRTYALLLQNNQELRPTGGFIQAVALLNFDNGSLVSYQVYSVYDLDKKLPGKVIPPDQIKEHLGEENWYLRDSNWNPDFPKTGTQVEWFIEKSLGATIDGVISMNVFSLEDLIDAVGPINLPEYNEVLTSKNIEERMEFHSEVVLVDSPESIDYSVKVLSETLKALSEIEEDDISTLLFGLRKSLDTKQAQIYLNEQSEQTIMGTLGWTGSLTPPNCPSRLSVVDCTVDSIAQVEANIGINKANYYLDRSISHKIMVSKQSAQHTRTVVFDNTAQSNAWPKGTYKSFIRFYINPESTVEKALINGSELSRGQIIESEENGYKVVALRVDVPIQKQLSLDLVYSTPLTKDGSFSYVFYNKKQSGLNNDPFTVQITHSQDIKPVLVAPNATITGNTILFSSQALDDASLFGVKFE